MIEIRQIKLPVNHKKSDLDREVGKVLGVFTSGSKTQKKEHSYRILRRSVDARKKPDVFYVYSVCVDVDEAASKQVLLNNNKKKGTKRADVSLFDETIYSFPKFDTKLNDVKPPVIVGSGPAGLFCAYCLALAGLKPIVLERGQNVDDRTKTVDEYWKGGQLKPDSNVQFGEGGAGTFSDGKLNTLTKDRFGRQKFVLDTFIKFGADEAIGYEAKPHIGTDVLTGVVKNMRNAVIEMGGRFLFDTKFVGFETKEGNVSSVRTSNKEVSHIETDRCILAIGHSARDTFEMLYEEGLLMEQKSFAAGFRMQHPQSRINKAQYGSEQSEFLPSADYKVANEASNGRRVYSFCMCPGGYVVNASSEEGHMCVNGMSYSGRDSEYANAAIIVGIDPADFVVPGKDIADNHALKGMYYQRDIEKKAFERGGGAIPVQYFADFERSDTADINKDKSSNVDSENHCIKGKAQFAQLRGIFAKDIEEAVIESVHKFAKSIEGFDDPESLLLGVEARTSSPVRILRDEDYESVNVKGIFPCGEGAGYAGGIMSAAVDGIKVAEAVAKSIINERR